MNGTEQRNHTKVTTQLTNTLEAVAKATAQRLDGHDADVTRLREAIGNERMHRLKLADEQRSYVDGQDRELRRDITERDAWQTAKHDALATDYLTFRTRTFWQRLNWLVTGR